MFSRTLLLAAVFCMCSYASAGIMSADHSVFGVGSLTRDTDQGLDFLDVTLSTNRSFDDVSGQFGVGGDFEGFRYATESEVVGLINNYGFLPTLTNFSEFSTGGVDYLSGLVSLLGVTHVNFGRLTIGYTSTRTQFGGGTELRALELRDQLQPNATSDIVTFRSVSGFASPFAGSYLVQASPQNAVPEPRSLTVFAMVAGVMGFAGRRQRGKKSDSPR